MAAGMKKRLRRNFVDSTETTHFHRRLRRPRALRAHGLDRPPACEHRRRLSVEKKGHSAGDWNVLRFYTMANTATKQPGRMQPSPAERRRAWLVHAYTGTGAVLAFLAAWGVVHGYDRVTLGAMFVATIVDGTDGMLARRVRVKAVLPDVDGGRIDDIVDYMTFVL